MSIAAKPKPQQSAQRGRHGPHDRPTVEDTKRALRISRQPLSLDQPVGHQDESFLGDLVYDHREEDPLAGMNLDMLKTRR